MARLISLSIAVLAAVLVLAATPVRAAEPATRGQLPQPVITVRIENLNLPPGTPVPRTYKELIPYLNGEDKERVSALLQVKEANDDPAQLVRFLDHGDAEVRKYAIEVLVYRADGALESLYEGALGDNARIKSNAVWALRRIDPRNSTELLGVLLKLKNDPDRQVRLNICALFARTNRKAVPSLIELLEDRQEDVRAKAAEVLGALKNDSEEAVPFLVDRLKDRSPAVRAAAAGAIGQIGPWAVQFSEAALSEAMSDTEETVRSRAAIALSQSESGLRRFIEGLDDPQENRRSANAAALAAGGARAVPLLCESLKHKKAHVRYWSAYALGQIGRDAEAALPQLTALTQDQDPQVRYYANLAVAKIKKP